MARCVEQWGLRGCTRWVGMICRGFTSLQRAISCKEAGQLTDLFRKSKYKIQKKKKNVNREKTRQGHKK